MGYDFFDDYEDKHGILENRDDPFGSYKDSDAIEDLNNEDRPIPMQGMRGPDGLVAPAPQFDGMAVLNSPSTVKMICLHGPCKHYTEVVQLDGQNTRTIRRCDRLATWAEQLKLDEANVLGCSRHELDSPAHPEIERWIEAGYRAVRRANEKASRITGQSLGVCHEASCEHYGVIVLESIDEQGEPDVMVHRFCLKMAGAARPFKLDPNSPMLGCLAVKPGYPMDAVDRSREQIELQRARFMKKGEVDDRGDPEPEPEPEPDPEQRGDQRGESGSDT